MRSPDRSSGCYGNRGLGSACCVSGWGSTATGRLVGAGPCLGPTPGATGRGLTRAEGRTAWRPAGGAPAILVGGAAVGSGIVAGSSGALSCAGVLKEGGASKRPAGVVCAVPVGGAVVGSGVMIGSSGSLGGGGLLKASGSSTTSVVVSGEELTGPGSTGTGATGSATSTRSPSEVEDPSPGMPAASGLGSFKPPGA